jgi:hypothetical protein
VKLNISNRDKYWISEVLSCNFSGREGKGRACDDVMLVRYLFPWQRSQTLRVPSCGTDVTCASRPQLSGYRRATGIQTHHRLAPVQLHLYPPDEHAMYVATFLHFYKQEVLRRTKLILSFDTTRTAERTIPPTIFRCLSDMCTD